ncbi:MAG: outer membrane protein assembly factor BamE [Gemmataceae bacterium]|nr:outer membrane protein assembly factor BamE [Gemmataceae bacterium]
MTKKRFVYLCLLVVVILSGVILCAGYQSWCPIRHNYSRIREGMTPAQVEEILGAKSESAPAFRSIRFWRGKDSTVAVFFDQNERVRTWVLSDEPDERSFLQRVLAFFKRS